jgi:hypothetical protein
VQDSAPLKLDQADAGYHEPLPAELVTEIGHLGECLVCKTGRVGCADMLVRLLQFSQILRDEASAIGSFMLARMGASLGEVLRRSVELTFEQRIAIAAHLEALAAVAIPYCPTAARPIGSAFESGIERLEVLIAGLENLASKVRRPGGSGLDPCRLGGPTRE